MTKLSALALLPLLLALSGTVSAADCCVDATPGKAAVKPYPMDTCIVSGEKLGEMGAPVVVVKDGQEVKFCCNGCVKKFDKDPAPFLKKIDEAAAAKGVPAKAPEAATPAPAAPDHAAHH